MIHDVIIFQTLTHKCTTSEVQILRPYASFLVNQVITYLIQVQLKELMFEDAKLTKIYSKFKNVR